MGDNPSSSNGASHGRGQRRKGHGSRGNGGERRKRDLGRAEYFRNSTDKRARNDERQRNAKRQKLEQGEEQLPVYATKFTKEEIDAQDRRPKRKVAVMIGYSGSGYKGMQVSPTEKTIEGDLFGAFVAAGAISKANADNPQKSSLVRCARTDKGVHAAGNVISLKLIVEDPDVVQKINEKLSPQIRVWGIERTNGSFSAYQFCDSRVYEYLIPTYCFLPPHPRSFLGKKLLELAEEADDLAGYNERQREVLGFWSDIEATSVTPLFKDSDQDLSERFLKMFYESSNSMPEGDPQVLEQFQQLAISLGFKVEEKPPTQESDDVGDQPRYLEQVTPLEDDVLTKAKEVRPLDQLLRHLKEQQVKAKKAYRIGPDRLARVRSSFARFEGSHKFHNYTINKTARDASATRIIKSFVVAPDPIIINDTEWLSLKVHGQSFMMHQIRKMVSMVAMVVRCGCHEGRIQDTYLPERLSIPKAPSLGLLLERPVFDGYNKKLKDLGREAIDFSKYQKEIDEFKQREIYEQIFRVEEAQNTFHMFFTGLDQVRSAQLFYLSSIGVDATKRDIGFEAVDGFSKEGVTVVEDNVPREDLGVFPDLKSTAVDVHEVLSDDGESYDEA